nr:hypothetical protein [uncultured Faecalimonas sp.]
MKQMISQVTTIEKKWKEGLEHFSDKYPVAACMLAFLGAPAFLVGALTVFTTAVMFPVSMIFGWM